jgi:hypothetical protein
MRLRNVLLDSDGLDSNVRDFHLHRVLAVSVAFAVAFAAFFVEDDHFFGFAVARDLRRDAALEVWSANFQAAAFACGEDFERYFAANFLANEHRHGEHVGLLDAVLEASDFNDCKHDT